LTKVELNSRYSEARKLGECLVGCEIISTHHDKVVSFISVFDGEFMIDEPIYTEDGDGYQVISEFYQTTNKITLDISTSKPNIYKLMEHGFEVDIRFSNGKVETYDLNDMDQKIELLEELRDSASQIKSINILDLDKLEGVEINDD
jgi:hypothetical protein